MPLFGLINAWISPPGVCGAGLRGSVGSGVELEFEGETVPCLTLPQTLSLFFHSHGVFGLLLGTWEGV